MSAESVVDGGVYVESIRGRLGTGDTAKDAQMENFWRARLQPDGSLCMELLNNFDQPTGYVERLAPGDLAGRFRHVPDFQPRQVDLKLERANKLAARAERHLADQEYLSAEFEFSSAVKIDRDNVRAHYGLGQTYLATGDTEKAKEAFRRLVEIDEVAEPQHKHIFNDLGIQLRRQGMYAEAVRHYRRALALAGDDENLWFNLGRALYEGGMAAKAVPCLQKALALNPGLEEAKAFLHAARKAAEMPGAVHGKDQGAAA